MTDPRAAALRIISALRQGSNCLEGTHLFSAGRDSIIQAADDIFSELEISDGSVVRWIKGAYGQGKTHLFARLIEIAHARRWASSYVQVSTRGQGKQLHRFEEIYSATISSILCRDLIEASDGRVSPGQVDGWTWILDTWFQALRRQAVGRDVGEVPSFRLRDVISQALTALRKSAQLHGAFLAALREYALARADIDEPWTETILGWFHGAPIQGLDPDRRKRLKECGIHEPVTRRNAKEMLRSLCAFLRYRGFAGFLILFDEVENVMQETSQNRRTSYTILRELIDNVDDRHGLRRTAFYISATPDLFEAATGMTEYEALAARVVLAGSQPKLNPAGSVVDLSLAPLDPSHMVEMAIRITSLYAAAQAWQPMASTPLLWESFLAQSRASNPDLSARLWVRQVIDRLDQLHQDSRHP